MEKQLARIVAVVTGNERGGIERALEGLGDLHIVTDAAVIADLVRRLRPDLVVAVASNGEGAEYLRAIKSAADVPVVVMGLEEEGARIAALEAGASDALPGSISIRETRARITAWLRASAAPRDLPRQSDIPRVLEDVGEVFIILDRDWRYRYVNRLAATFMGQKPEEMIGVSIWERFPFTVDGVFYQELHRAAETGEPAHFEIYSGMYDRWFEFDASPSESGISILARDVTERKRTAEALRDSESRFTVLTRAINDVIWDWDLADDRVWRSQGASDLFGFPGDEIDLTAAWWFDHIHPDDLPRVRSSIDEAITGTRDLWSEEYRFIRGNNEQIHIFDRGYLLRDTAGRPIRMIGAMIDLSKLKHAELAARQANDRLGFAVDASGLGTWYCDLPFNRLIWNDKCKAHFGLAPDVDVTIDLFYELIHPEDREPTRMAIEQSIATHSYYKTEFRTQGADGGTRWIMASGQCGYDEGGTPLHFDGVTVDMTDVRRSEQVLREQEERLRVALLASGTGTYRWDIDNDAIVWDEGMDRLFGSSSSAAIHTIADFIAHVHPDDRERVRLEMKRSISERIDLDIEFRMIRANGGVLWLANKGRLLADGTPHVMTGACVDITERRKGELERAELLELERDARAKAEQTGDRIARLQAVTSALSVALTPLQVADVIIDLGIGAFGASAGSMSLLTDDGEVLEVIRARGYSKTMLSNWRRMAMDRAVPLTDCIRTRQVIIVSGRTERTRLFPEVFRSEHLHAHHGIAAIPLILADRPVGAIGLSFSDGWEFTDEDHAFMRALAQQCVQALERARLYEAEQRAHAAAEMRWHESVRLADINRDLATSIELSEVISTICRAARELTAADGAAFIIREGELVYYADENSIAPLWKGSRFPITTCVSGWSILNRQAITMRDVFNDFRVPTELYRPTFVRSLAMVPVRANDPLGAVGVYWAGCHQATDHEIMLLNALADAATIALINAQLYEQTRNAKIEAEAANRMKDEFLATVSHEIRTPLNAILGWAQILRTGDLDAETTERALETVERNAKAQAQLIDDILDISRIITGKIHLEARPVDLDPIIGATVESMRPAAAAKSIHIRMIADRFAGPVMGDPNRLQQVIWNLVSNAIKFTPVGGEVEVRLEKAGESALIVVSDTGQGITPEFMPYVFDRFRQADGTITRKHGGLGLGLAIVRHLLDLHDGSVSAESAGPGKGSTFTVALPIVRLQERGEPAGAAPNVPPAETFTLHGVRIVVVDDEPDTLEMLSTTLRQSGATVNAVSSVEKALMAIEHSMPDLLVSDIGMPDEDGYSLIRKVRGLSGVRWKDLPAVALTAYAGAEDRRRAIEAGYQRHVTKPVEPAELITVIASLINGRG